MINILLLHGSRRTSKYLFLILVPFLSLLCTSGLSGQKAVLKVGIYNIKEGTGQISVGFYSSEEEWPYEPKYSYAIDKKGRQGESVWLEILDMEPGTYALSVLDDENRSGGMEYFCGIPREGWGFSNNPPVLRLTAPSFKQCEFILKDTTMIEVRMNYLGQGSRK